MPKRRLRLVLMGLIGLACVACGSSAGSTIAATEPEVGTTTPKTSTSASTATSMTLATTSTTLTHPVDLPVGSVLPPGQRACTASDMEIQSASGTVTPEGAFGLFVRVFRSNQGPCWIDGYPGVSLRTDDGTWTIFALHTSDFVATNGPTWTGVFDPKLTGIVVFGASVPPQQGTEPPQRYTAFRLVLPNDGGTLEGDGIDITLNSRDLTVHAFEADSQDP